MQARILKEKQQQWLEDLRKQLVALQGALSRFPPAPADAAVLQEAINRMTELFLLVVVGEFNSGKSIFINALLGSELLEVGAVPTTSRIQIIRFGEKIHQRVENEALEVVTAPIPLLEQLHIVDTPGTNAIDRQHEAITREFIPRADLVLFVTSADRPFTESERNFLEQIREWGKKVVIVLNKVDILEGEQDRARVEAYVRQNAKALLHVEPELFSISARAALRAKTAQQPSGADGFVALERFITETLDEDERVRLKLLNPIGVGERLSARYLEGAEEQAQILKQDLAAMDELERQFAFYREDMERDFHHRLSGVDNVLHELELRGHDFIEDMIRLPRVADLLNRSKLKADFLRKVVADAPEQVEKRVNDTIDWLVSNDLQQWQTVQDFLARRRSERASEAVGELAARFDYDRTRVMNAVGGTAQRTLDEYDREQEAARMADSVQGAVANTAVLQVGAIGLGTIVTLAATSTAADVTGFLAAGVLATLGFLVLPRRRRSAKRELRDKIAVLREQMMKGLETQFTDEIERSLNRRNESLAPYTRFLRAEEKLLAEKRTALIDIRGKLAALRADIEESAS